MKELQSLVKNSIESMHNNGFVHGDVRTNNILVSNDFTQIWIIDFDWAGRIKEAKYPMFMNVDIQWPVGACAGNLILPEHDLKMVENFN